MLPISFEFYPPKTDEQRAQLDRTADKLKVHAPEYVSCTFGAGGSTLSHTPETVRRLRQRLDAVFEDAIFQGHTSANPAAMRSTSRSAPAYPPGAGEASPTTAPVHDRASTSAATTTTPSGMTPASA